MGELKSGVPLVRALERGLAILEAFDTETPQLSLSELAKRTSLDVGTTRRMLQTLMITGFVGYNENASRYFLTRRILEISAAVETGRDLREVSTGYLRNIAEKTGATVFLWTYDNGFALCVDRIRATIPNVSATWFTVGGKTTLNCGAGPRVLLAYLSPAERADALNQDMIKRTPASIVDRSVLSRDASEIREKGWDLAVDDFVVGLAGLGVPILTVTGVLVGALSISSLTTIFGDPASPTHLDLVRASAVAIGAQMSGDDEHLR
ncbi:IclR family transcriptional regulator [Pseudaminobacter sp. NGMCC 1.201702]|uniref:IclR family transcriptional regulator n=1 Tax=Pseudaminobacter sp. NGMCC 1.201702 TaxID=3391825 RepID=UPI0039EEDE6C